MQKYKFIFVILTYRSYEDIQECINSISACYDSYKIVVVNSFFDSASKDIFEKIARDNHCDFINVENKGYSYGNNIGIKYVREKYLFDFLIISNPDIVIKKNAFNYQKFLENPVVIAPCITTRTGKHQNPYWVVENKTAERLIYIGFKKRNSLIAYTGFAINKLIRIVFIAYTNLFRKKINKVFAAHGSFIIFNRKVFEKLNVIYDENMFLFAEEALLAHRLKQNNIPILYTNEIEIYHKEDGSVGIAHIDEKSILRKSIIYYFEYLKQSKEV